MVNVPDLMGPTAQFIANSAPGLMPTKAAQQAGLIADKMAVAPGIAKILGGLGQGPSPTRNAAPWDVAMSALNAGGMGQQQQPNQATIQPRGAPELYSQLAGMGQAQGMFQPQPKPYGQNLFLNIAGLGPRSRGA